jgi:hypothetical protein
MRSSGALVNVASAAPAKEPPASALRKGKLLSSGAAKAAAEARGLAVKSQEERTAADNPEKPVVSAERRCRRERTNELLLVFLRRWPAAFRRPWPLAIGVNAEIVAALAEQATPQEIGRAIRAWCGGDVYLGRLAAGKPRMGLDGTLGEPATEEQRSGANARLMARLSRRAAR